MLQANRTGWGLSLLMLPTFLVALDTTALLLALPRLSVGLGASNCHAARLAFQGARE